MPHLPKLRKNVAGRVVSLVNHPLARLNVAQKWLGRFVPPFALAFGADSHHDTTDGILAYRIPRTVGAAPSIGGFGVKSD